jgi:hypothetical protein
MRLTAEFWIAALLRRVFQDGGFGAVLRRGAAEAGAIFILERARDGSLNLYAPAPQSGYGPGEAGAERLFQLAEAGAPQETAERLIERELRFDPDCWVVEIEPGRSAASDLIRLVEP